MRLICGPMATISHPAFRILLEQFGGCDEYFTEMINAGTLLTGGQFESYYINPAPVPQKIVWQLTGHDCAHMVEAARRLVELPGIGLDLNMGCSAPDIYKYGAGISWMLKDIEETRQMVRAVRAVVPEGKRLSVKLRLGDDNFTDDGFFSFTDMLVDEGVELLTLHPRTKKEKLVRPPRYEYCQKLAERYKGRVSIYLNGNVKDKASYDFAVAACPDVEGVMISRAAVQKPWIFKTLREPQGPQTVVSTSSTTTNNSAVVEPVETTTQVDMLQLAQTYIKNIQLYQPPEFWKTRLQRFFTYYAQNFKFSHYAQTQFINARDIPDLEQRLNDFYEKCPEERFLNLNN